MTKIMLVEDDKSLREIYGVRLLAEGYDIVSAGDGEEALAVAIKERPSLIVTDVMMPKISGFDMLDILRSTTETKDIKVIMMTALSSDDNKDRSERLGADRYLVKSQVGIEDVVRVVHEVLGDQGQQPVAQPGLQSTAPAMSTTQPAPAPAVSRPAPAVAPAPPASPAPQPPAPVAIPQRPQVTPPSAPTPPVTRPQVPTTPPTTNVVSADDSPSRRARVIQPINSPADKPNIQDLVNREMAKEQADVPAPQPTVNAAPASDNTAPASTAEEKNVVQQQLNDFVKTPAPTPPQAPSTLPPFNPTTAATEEPEDAAPAPAVAAPQPSQPQFGFPQPQAPVAPAPPQNGPGNSPQPPQTPPAA